MMSQIEQLRGSRNTILVPLQAISILLKKSAAKHISIWIWCAASWELADFVGSPVLESLYINREAFGSSIACGKVLAEAITRASSLSCIKIRSNDFHHKEAASLASANFQIKDHTENGQKEERCDFMMEFGGFCCCATWRRECTCQSRLFEQMSYQRTACLNCALAEDWPVYIDPESRCHTDFLHSHDSSYHNWLLDSLCREDEGCV